MFSAPVGVGLLPVPLSGEHGARLISEAQAMQAILAYELRVLQPKCAEGSLYGTHVRGIDLDSSRLPDEGD
jgi:hypothetical protein